MTQGISDKLYSNALALGLVLLGASVSGCASFDVGLEPQSSPRNEDHGNLRIPPGHLPAPGECRIWFPGRPPGQQPPPGKCDDLRHDVPIGAWLIERPKNDDENVHVNVYDSVRKGYRIGIRIYNAATGIYVRARTP